MECYKIVKKKKRTTTTWHNMDEFYKYSTESKNNWRSVLTLDINFKTYQAVVSAV